jgi:hypothetical protein
MSKKAKLRPFIFQPAANEELSPFQEEKPKKFLLKARGLDSRYMPSMDPIPTLYERGNHMQS